MQCTVCGSQLNAINTDLPFKVREGAIVILKDVPVLQCGNCAQYVLQDTVMAKVDEILQRVGSEAELEIIRFAA